MERRKERARQRLVHEIVKGPVVRDMSGATFRSIVLLMERGDCQVGYAP